MKKLLKSGLAGGIILFIWSAISWMALPWHMTTTHGFKDEVAVAQVLTANASQSGVYFMPLHQEASNQINMPQVFASVHLEGMTSMNTGMIIQVAIQIIAAFLVAWLLMQARDLSYWGRVGFVVIFALASGIICHLPYWNWFAFDINYTLVEIADLLIGWFLAGLVMAKLVD